TPVGRAVRIKDSTTPTSQLVAFLDSQGNLYCQGYGFIGADPDAFEADTTITVGPPGYDYDCEYTDDEEPYDYEDPGSQAIQDAFTRATVLGITYPVIVVYPRFENGVPVETVYNPFNFNGVDAVVQSVTPEDRSVVAATVIEDQALWTQPVVAFGGSETSRAALKGFTIRNGKPGIAGYGTHATILNNVISGNNNYTIGAYGGGILDCDGLIQYNVIEWNFADYGTGLANCDGTVTNNIIRYNDATEAGGGLYQCGGRIGQNRIYNKWADQGAGLANCGASSYVFNNLVFRNLGDTAGAGMYQCGGVIEFNTVYDNRAPTGAGLYDCDGTIHSNILWLNRVNGNESNPPASDQITESSNPTYCCIQNWASGGEGNINSNPLFVSVTFGAPWHEYLHLSADSPCIDLGDFRGPRSASATLDRDHRDIDDQPTFVEIDGRGRVYDPDAWDQDLKLNPTLPYDIGADEYPTPAQFSFWWDNLE
ncbi:MAG: right-handed parallel beta-helix repeat-containing protein, partial [Candidatus Hydrogenedentes bacterium]|nr:right-handed parallel beta-helix repeat-containing protein [Candidatus Hydrogenedentota bacterium]